MERTIFTHAVSKSAMQSIVDEVIQECGIGRWPVVNPCENAMLTQLLSVHAQKFQLVDFQVWYYEQLLEMVEAKLTVKH